MTLLRGIIILREYSNLVLLTILTVIGMNYTKQNLELEDGVYLGWAILLIIFILTQMISIMFRGEINE